MFHTPSRVSGELQSPGLGIAFNHHVEAWLVNRNLAPIEALNFAGINVDADHVVAGVCQTSPGNEAHVAGAENRNAHISF